MGSNQSSSPSSSYSEEFPKKSAEELLNLAEQSLVTSKLLIKEMNEKQYCAYEIFNAQNRLLKQFPILSDMKFFMKMIEADLRERQKTPLCPTTSKKACLIFLTRTAALMQLISYIQEFHLHGSQILLKNAELIDLIDISLSKDKKEIKKKLGLRKKLDAVLLDLHQSSQALEVYIAQKLQMANLSELEFAHSRLAALYNDSAKQLQEYSSQDDKNREEEQFCQLAIPHELE